MELICVDPAQVKEFWPFVSHYIKAACRRGLCDFEGHKNDILTGRALLWLAWDGDKIKAAASTELHKVNDRKLCFIVALGGSGRSEWLPLITGIEKYARTEGCQAITIMGRKGWARALPRYQPRGVILERTL